MAPATDQLTAPPAAPSLPPGYDPNTGTVPAASQGTAPAATPTPLAAPGTTETLPAWERPAGRIRTAAEQAQTEKVGEEIAARSQHLVRPEDFTTGWINDIAPSLNPDFVAQAQAGGYDDLGLIFGKTHADYLRDAILHGYTPEVFARAAAQSLGDWEAPANRATDALSPLAYGYATAAKEAQAAGDVAEASKQAYKAHLIGLLGAAGNVGFSVQQTKDLIDNWDKMTPAERVMGLGGLVGQGLLAGVGLHEAGATDKVRAAANHLRETGKTFIDASKEEGKRWATATAPEGEPEAGHIPLGEGKLDDLGTRLPDLQTAEQADRRDPQTRLFPSGNATGVGRIANITHDILRQHAAEAKANAPTIEPIGIHGDDLPHRAKYQDVDFSARDLQDSGKTVNEDTVRRDYANNRKDVSVYKAYVPMEDIPSSKFPAEPETEQEAADFDREEYSRPRTGVPVKLSVTPKGEIQILDGNHRLQVWSEQDQQYAPAWVVDYRGPNIENLSEDEKAERADETEAPDLQTADLAERRDVIRQNEAEKLPPQPKLPDTGTYPAIQTDDGGIYPDVNNEYGTHIRLAQALGIPADRIVSGGWLADGDYEGSPRSDAGRYGEQARAQKAIAAKRAAAQPTIEHRENVATFGSGSEAPQEMSQVRLKQGDKTVGRLNYVIDPATNTASVKGMAIDDNPNLRGKGYAQQMILTAADHAKAKGVTALTSDLQGTTTFEAARAWDGVAAKGHPVEKIPSKPGSPGYVMDLTKPSPLPQYGQAASEQGNLPGQKIQLGDLQAKYVGRETPQIKTPETALAYHPDLQKMADKYGVVNTPSGGPEASFIAPDGKFIRLPAGGTHDTAIDFVTGRQAGPEGDNRIGFLNDTGAIRLRVSNDKAGKTAHLSTPPQGVTPEQIPAVQQAIAAAGRNGNVVMERADVTPETKDQLTMSKEFPRPSDAADYLRQIQAHPDQHPESDLMTNERQSPLKEPYAIEITGKDGTTRTESVDAFSSKDALKTAQKKFPDATEWASVRPGARTPSTEYSVPTGKLLSTPPVMGKSARDFYGRSKEDAAAEDAAATLRTMYHELGGHGMIGLKEGMTPKGVVRHTHPDASSNTRAAVSWDASDLYIPGTRQFKPDKVDAVVKNFMGGPAADEVFSGVPRAANHNFDYTERGSDGYQAYNALRDAGYNHDDALARMHEMVDENKEYLTKPEVSDVIKENVGVREPGLSTQYHHSPERMQNMHAEIQRRIKANGANTEDINNGAAGGGGPQDHPAVVARGEGGVSETAGQVPGEVAKTPAAETAPEVNPHDLVERAQQALAAGDKKTAADLLAQARAALQSSELTTAEKKKTSVGFINPKGEFEGFNEFKGLTAKQMEHVADESEHSDFASNRDTTITALGKKGWVRKAGAGTYDVQKLTPTTQRAIEHDIIQDHPAKIYIEGQERLYPFSYDDFIEKYNGDLSRAMQGSAQGDKVPELVTAEIKKPSVPAEKPDYEKAADQFNLAHGRPPIEKATENVDPELGKKTADLYDQMQHDPNNPKVQKAFEAMKKDVDDQWNYVTKDLGVKIEPWTKEGQPYSNSQAMRDDVNDNQHLYFSRVGEVGEHPFAEKDKAGLTYQDKFRSIHDFFGHVVGNNEFGPTGERRAYLNHRQMFSAEAQPAMTALTQGQNSWVNFGPHMRNQAGELLKPGEPGYIPLKDRPFAEQKVGLLPGKREFQPVDRDKYAQEVANSPHAASLSQVSETPGQIYQMTVDGDPQRVYYSINKDGDIAGVVNNSGGSIKGALNAIMPHAIEQGGDHLDAWSIKGTLPKLYSKYGFEITKVEPYDADAFGEPSDALKQSWRLSGWNDKEPYPSVVHMALPKAIEKMGGVDKPNYPTEDRIKDMNGEKQSDIPKFENTPKWIYDHLTDDAKAYLKDNPGLQKRMVAEVHNEPLTTDEAISVAAASSDANGWWRRFSDIMNRIGDAGKNKTTKKGVPWGDVFQAVHSSLSGNKLVEDANNLSWGVIYDWLKAGQPTDRPSLDAIVRNNGAVDPLSGKLGPTGEPKKGNAAMSDTLNKKGKVVHENLDTTELYRLMNSPEMKGEKSFGGKIWSEESPIEASGAASRKLPSMLATTAGGDLSNAIIDSIMGRFMGRVKPNLMPRTEAKYLADTVFLKRVGDALDRPTGEAQEQIWTTTQAFLKHLKDGLTPEEAADKIREEGTYSSSKDYADIILKDQEVVGKGGYLDRLKKEFGIGPGSAGVTELHKQTRLAEPPKAGESRPIDRSHLATTGQRIFAGLSEKRRAQLANKAASTEEEQTAFPFGANAPEELPPTPQPKPKKMKGAVSAMSLLSGLKKAGSKPK